jgi:gluconokinase
LTNFAIVCRFILSRISRLRPAQNLGVRKTMKTVIKIVFIMGPTGAGKTTIGKELARRLAVQFIDADDIHTPECKAQMNAENPLREDQRAAWFARLRACISEATKSSELLVVACSALTKVGRALLSEGWKAFFIYLSVPPKVASFRFENRPKGGEDGHWLIYNLVPTQFGVLEPPTDDEALIIDATNSVDATLELVEAGLPVFSG